MVNIGVPYRPNDYRMDLDFSVIMRFFAYFRPSRED